MIFKTNEDKIDTIFVEEITSIKTATGGRYFQNIGDIGKGDETLFVSGEISLEKPRKQAGKLYYREYVDLLRLEVSKEEFGYLVLENIKGRNWSYKNRIHKTDSLDRLEGRKLHNLNDVIVFVNDKIGHKNDDNVLINIFWSKKYGYIRYEFKDGSYWELQKFIRDNKNILK